MDDLYLDWLIPDRVAFFEFHGDFQLASLNRADDWLKRALDEAQQPVHLVADLTHIGDRYPSLHVQLQAKSIRHPCFGHMITIRAANDPIRRFFLNTIVHVARKSYCDFDTREAALGYLNQLEPTLPDLLSLHAAK